MSVTAVNTSPVSGPARRRRTVMVALLAMLLWGCVQATPPGASVEPAASSRASATASASLAPGGSVGPLGEMPASARVSNGGPDPRSTGYWIMWSTCGEGSQAEVARQNGGRDAGWILVDDLIADPGLALGDHVIGSCREAVDLLSGIAGAAPGGDVEDLARQVLTAELNLSTGAESCAAVEGAVRIGQLLLSSLDYGTGGPARSPDAREAALVSEAGGVLADYNLGALCR